MNFNVLFYFCSLKLKNRLATDVCFMCHELLTGGIGSFKGFRGCPKLYSKFCVYSLHGRNIHTFQEVLKVVDGSGKVKDYLKILLFIAHTKLSLKFLQIQQSTGHVDILDDNNTVEEEEVRK